MDPILKLIIIIGGFVYLMILDARVWKRGKGVFRHEAILVLLLTLADLVAVASLIAEHILGGM